MERQSHRSRYLALPGALLLSVLLAGQTLAATWAPPVALTSADVVYQGDIAGAGTTAVAIYASADSGKVMARRTTNSGSTWSAAVQLASVGMFPAIAGNGVSFYAVWNSSTGRVRHARSTNGGASFGASVALSPAGRYAWRPSIASDGAGRLAVAWEDYDSGEIKARVSLDGGASFGAAQTVATGGIGAGTAVAIGDGVLYVAYSAGPSAVRVKRSLNWGSSWSAPTRVTGALAAIGISMTAAGSQAYVAYAADSSYGSKVRYRRTTDKGATWSAQMDLGPPTWTTYEQHLALQGGVLRATFTRCKLEVDVCIDERVFYRQSSNGTIWSTSERVSPTGLWDAYSGRVTHAGKILALYVGDSAAGANPYVRVGSP
jgi:hypothetical protein